MIEAPNTAHGLTASLMTCSFRGDFEVCKLLCESIDRFVPDSITHRLLVPKNDMSLFAPLANRRRVIETQEAQVPRWLKKLPLPGPRWRALLGLPHRNIYVTPFSRPVRGWIAQQIMKIAAASTAATEIVVHVDSDNVIIRPLRLENLVDGNGRARLYQNPQGVDRDSHASWHLAASRILGLPPDKFHGGDYIDPLVVWRRSVVQRLIARIEAVSASQWQKLLARTPHFSEYILYGVFAERVLGLETAGHQAQDFTMSHSRWSDGFDSGAQETAFVEALRPAHVLCNIQSTVGLTLADRRRIFDRIASFAARQDEAAAR